MEQQTEFCKILLNNEEQAIHQRMQAREKAMFQHAFEGLLCHSNAASHHLMTKEEEEAEHQCWIKIAARFETVVTMLENFDPNKGGGKTPLERMKGLTALVDYPFLGHSPLEIATYEESAKYFEDECNMPNAIERFNAGLMNVSQILVADWMQTTDYTDEKKMEQIVLDDVRPLLVTAVRVSAADQEHEEFHLAELGTCAAHLETSPLFEELFKNPMLVRKVVEQSPEADLFHVLPKMYGMKRKGKVFKAKERASRMEHCSFRYSVLVDLISCLMSSIESYLTNKPKHVYTKTSKIEML